MKKEYNFTKGKRGAIADEDTLMPTSFKLKARLLKWLEAQSKEQGISRSEFLNSVLEKAIKEMK